MSRIDDFMNGKCGLNSLKSRAEDIQILSEYIKNKYPNSGRPHRDWHFPTLMSFYQRYPYDVLTIYRTKTESYDGYTFGLDDYPYPIYTAYQMIEDVDTFKIVNIRWSEIKKLFE